MQHLFCRYPHPHVLRRWQGYPTPYLRPHLIYHTDLQNKWNLSYPARIQIQYILHFHCLFLKENVYILLLSTHLFSLLVHQLHSQKDTLIHYPEIWHNLKTTNLQSLVGLSQSVLFLHRFSAQNHRPIMSFQISAWHSKGTRHLYALPDNQPSLQPHAVAPHAICTE